MIVSLAEDFTADVTLDVQLLAIPDSGLYLNSGTHPSLTLENLLAFLPAKDIICEPYKASKTYVIYEDSRNKNDIVLYDSKLYQSIVTGNIGNTPDASPTKWVVTNKESLVLKSLIYKVTDKVQADLGLTKRLINHQKIYELGETLKVLPNDYSAFVFEFKGSEFVTISLNRILLTKNSTSQLNVYVVNQGNLVTTLTVTPDNGDINWVEQTYSFTGAGKWFFIIDSTEVLVGNGYIDPLKYDGFIVYTASGIGGTPESAVYSASSSGNGLGFDVSVYKDAAAYLTDNLDDLGNLFRATFEYVVFQMFLHNPNNKSNRAERLQMNEDLLMTELKNLNGDTVVARLKRELQEAKRVMARTDDTALGNNNDNLIIELGTI